MVVDVVVVWISGEDSGGVGVLAASRKRLEKVFGANLPLALRASFIVHDPEVLVEILPLFKEQEPETDQVFVPVELLEAMEEVR